MRALVKISSICSQKQVELVFLRKAFIVFINYKVLSLFYQTLSSVMKIS
jgi:hypothetical protein